MKYDLIVVGGGPAGLAAAKAAREAGRDPGEVKLCAACKTRE